MAINACATLEEISSSFIEDVRSLSDEEWDMIEESKEAEQHVQ